MTDTITLTTNEMSIWNNGSLWQRAYIAYTHNAMHLFTETELTELVQTVSKMNFIANMSDDWAVTRREVQKNNTIAAIARDILEQ